MRINEMLGTEFPFIQGAMANIATGSFAAAVSNAGGLGIIGSGGMSPETLREHIAQCRALTSQPFGVNIMLMHPQAAEMAHILVEEKISFITTGAGNPAQFIPMWKAAGAKVLPVIPIVALAKLVERAGADAVIAEGTEAGGHVGELTTMALVPQVADAVSIPVVAAGGIADGRQLLAAYALGACGVQLGTSLLVSEECPIHQNYKDAILKAKDSGTTVTGRIAGAPVRTLKNQMSKTYLSREKEGAKLEELEQYTLGSLRKAVFDGDTKNGSLMAGQVAGQLHEIRPLRTIFEDLFVGAKARLNQVEQECNR